MFVNLPDKFIHIAHSKSQWSLGDLFYISVDHLLLQDTYRPRNELPLTRASYPVSTTQYGLPTGLECLESAWFVFLPKAQKVRAWKSLEMEMTIRVIGLI